ncbi:MAG: Eco57I restriction-modification methylase domain-containing protein, partial [Caldisericaceae bacterium]
MNEVDYRIIMPDLEKMRDKGIDTDLLRKLFIEKLNYDFADKGISIKFRQSVKDSVLSTRVIAEKNEFKIVLCQIETLLKGKEIDIVKDISAYYPDNLIIITNKDSSEAHFINTKYVGKEQKKKVKGFRRISVGKTDRLRTAAERLSMLYADTDSTLALMQKCIDAFDVEAVTKEFYNEFVKKYKALRGVIQKTNGLLFKDADELTQNILNRLLFLYFVQKKGWLNNDYQFLYNNFKSNHKEYYKDFLIPLFRKLSEKTFSAPGFENIPFLNGGLFEFHPQEAEISIPNDAFSGIFDDLLERFNFTVREDTEHEEEVAIDPEMLGKIFEQLILSVESAEYKDIPDPRRESGSYYTPRFIVSFMVKQSLLNYLTNELPQVQKAALKRLVFDLSSEGIKDAESIKDKLLDLKIVDPGVGSGAFPVEVLNRLVLVIDALDKQLGIDEDRFKLRKKLIEHCIYGVDIQNRAVHIARLRLWLSLIVELDVDKIKDIPPLINLDFKIVEGDSLESKIYGFKFDSKIPKQSNQKIIETVEKYVERYEKLKDEYSETSAEEKKKDLKE